MDQSVLGDGGAADHRPQPRHPIPPHRNQPSPPQTERPPPPPLPPAVREHNKGQPKGNVPSATLPAGAPPAGQWSHIAVPWDGTTPPGYVNGHQVGPATGPGAAVPQAGQPVAIGYDTTN